MSEQEKQLDVDTVRVSENASGCMNEGRDKHDDYTGAIHRNAGLERFNAKDGEPTIYLPPEMKTNKSTEALQTLSAITDPISHRIKLEEHAASISPLTSRYTEVEGEVQYVDRDLPLVRDANTEMHNCNRSSRNGIELGSGMNIPIPLLHAEPEMTDGRCTPLLLKCRDSIQCPNALTPTYETMLLKAAYTTAKMTGSPTEAEMYTDTIQTLSHMAAEVRKQTYANQPFVVAGKLQSCNDKSGQIFLKDRGAEEGNFSSKPIVCIGTVETHGNVPESKFRMYPEVQHFAENVDDAISQETELSQRDFVTDCVSSTVSCSDTHAVKTSLVSGSAVAFKDKESNKPICCWEGGSEISTYNENRINKMELQIYPTVNEQVETTGEGCMLLKKKNAEPSSDTEKMHRDNAFMFSPAPLVIETPDENRQITMSELEKETKRNSKYILLAQTPVYGGASVPVTEMEEVKCHKHNTRLVLGSMTDCMLQPAAIDTEKIKSDGTLEFSTAFGVDTQAANCNTAKFHENNMPNNSSKVEEATLDNAKMESHACIYSDTEKSEVDINQKKQEGRGRNIPHHHRFDPDFTNEIAMESPTLANTLTTQLINRELSTDAKMKEIKSDDTPAHLHLRIKPGSFVKMEYEHPLYQTEPVTADKMEPKPATTVNDNLTSFSSNERNGSTRVDTVVYSAQMLEKPAECKNFTERIAPDDRCYGFIDRTNNANVETDQCHSSNELMTGIEFYVEKCNGNTVLKSNVETHIEKYNEVDSTFVTEPQASRVADSVTNIDSEMKENDVVTINQEDMQVCRNYAETISVAEEYTVETCDDSEFMPNAHADKNPADNNTESNKKQKTSTDLCTRIEKIKEPYDNNAKLTTQSLMEISSCNSGMESFPSTNNGGERTVDSVSVLDFDVQTGNDTVEVTSAGSNVLQPEKLGSVYHNEVNQCNGALANQPTTVKMECAKERKSITVVQLHQTCTINSKTFSILQPTCEKDDNKPGNTTTSQLQMVTDASNDSNESHRKSEMEVEEKSGLIEYSDGIKSKYSGNRAIAENNLDVGKFAIGFVPFPQTSIEQCIPTTESAWATMGKRAETIAVNPESEVKLFGMPQAYDKESSTILESNTLVQKMIEDNEEERAQLPVAHEEEEMDDKANHDNTGTVVCSELATNMLATCKAGTDLTTLSDIVMEECVNGSELHSYQKVSRNTQGLNESDNLDSPESPAIQSYTPSPTCPEIQSYAQSPTCPEIQISSVTPKSPEIQISSVTPKSPEIQISSVTPKSPEIQISSVTPKPPEIHISTDNSKSLEVNFNTDTSKSLKMQINTDSSKPPNMQFVINTPKSPVMQITTASPKSPEVQIYTLIPNSPKTKDNIDSPNSADIKIATESEEVQINTVPPKSPEMVINTESSKSTDMQINKDTAKSPKVPVYNEISKSLKTQAVKITTESPEEQINPESPKSPEVQMSTAFPKSPEVQITTESPEDQITTESPKSSEMQITTESPKSSEMQITTESPKSPEMQISTEFLKSSEMKINTESPKSSEMQISTESPKSPEVQITTESPEDQINTESPKSPEVQIITDSPKSPDVKICTKSRISPDVQINTEYPESPKSPNIHITTATNGELAVEKNDYAQSSPSIFPDFTHIKHHSMESMGVRMGMHGDTMDIVNVNKSCKNPNSPDITFREYAVEKNDCAHSTSFVAISVAKHDSTTDSSDARMLMPFNSTGNTNTENAADTLEHPKSPYNDMGVAYKEFTVSEKWNTQSTCCMISTTPLAQNNTGTNTSDIQIKMPIDHSESVKSNTVPETFNTSFSVDQSITSPAVERERVSTVLNLQMNLVMNNSDRIETVRSSSKNVSNTNISPLNPKNRSCNDDDDPGKREDCERNSDSSILLENSKTCNDDKAILLKETEPMETSSNTEPDVSLNTAVVVTSYKTVMSENCVRQDQLTHSAETNPENSNKDTECFPISRKLEAKNYNLIHNIAVELQTFGNNDESITKKTIAAENHSDAAESFIDVRTTVHENGPTYELANQVEEPSYEKPKSIQSTCTNHDNNNDDNIAVVSLGVEIDKVNAEENIHFNHQKEIEKAYDNPEPVSSIRMRASTSLMLRSVDGGSNEELCTVTEMEAEKENSFVNDVNNSNNETELASGRVEKLTACFEPNTFTDVLSESATKADLIVHSGDETQMSNNSQSFEFCNVALLHPPEMATLKEDSENIDSNVHLEMEVEKCNDDDIESPRNVPSELDRCDYSESEVRIARESLPSYDENGNLVTWRGITNEGESRCTGIISDVCTIPDEVMSIEIEENVDNECQVVDSIKHETYENNLNQNHELTAAEPCATDDLRILGARYQLVPAQPNMPRHSMPPYSRISSGDYYTMSYRNPMEKSTVNYGGTDSSNLPNHFLTSASFRRPRSRSAGKIQPGFDRKSFGYTLVPGSYNTISVPQPKRLCSIADYLKITKGHSLISPIPTKKSSTQEPFPVALIKANSDYSTGYMFVRASGSEYKHKKALASGCNEEWWTLCYIEDDGTVASGPVAPSSQLPPDFGKPSIGPILMPKSCQPNQTEPAAKNGQQTQKGSRSSSHKRKASIPTRNAKRAKYAAEVKQELAEETAASQENYSQHSESGVAPRDLKAAELCTISSLNVPPSSHRKGHRRSQGTQRGNGGTSGSKRGQPKMPDPEHREVARQRNKLHQQKLRQDPFYRQMERERNRLYLQKLRSDPMYRQKERERNRIYREKLRQQRRDRGCDKGGQNNSQSNKENVMDSSRESESQ